MEESIEKIRRDAIAGIKEKVKKDQKYIHPCNKERQEDMKRLKFVNGNDFTNWMQQNGIMKNPAKVWDKYARDKYYQDKGFKNRQDGENQDAQKLGFKNRAERYRDYNREWAHNTGKNLPKEENPYCPSHFGDFTEDLMIKTFEDPIRMPYGNPGYDWTCKRGDKIDSKGRCLIYSKVSNWSGWEFYIDHNNIADWFILSCWDDRDSLNPLHVFAFHKNDIVRGRKFCEFVTFSITNTPKKLKELEKFEVTNRLDKLKELCNKDKE